MDDRKKRIDDLIKNNQESRASLDTLLVKFGEDLYLRSKDQDIDFEDIVRYNSCLKEIAVSNAEIAKIEEKNRKFIELEQAIEAGEKEEKEREKEIAAIYRKLGKALLDNSAYDDYTSLFKEQSDALKTKLDSLESRIDELENKEGGNVFSWIGKSAQGLVLKSFLTKAQESQQQLYHSIGERYSTRDSVEQEDEVAFILKDLEANRAASRAVNDEIAKLKDEKRMISASFGIDGDPKKQIQSVKDRIAQILEELRGMYRTFGAQATGISDSDIQPERKYFIDEIVTAEDGEIIGRAVKLNQSIIDNEIAITKLKASLAIDEERIKIDKYQRTIRDKKEKIIDLEKNIEELENAIEESEGKIKDLEKNL